MNEAQPTDLAQARREEVVERYAGYDSIITGVERQWEYGGFPLPDGTFWRYREPDAAVVVEGERMRVLVDKLTRSNDYVQILDNAKNMFFSARHFAVPENGEIAFEWEMSAQCKKTRPHDLYDGFVSTNLLDFTTGMALDVFVCNDVISTVYARLPFPGVPAPDEPEDTDKPKYFCHFNELPIETRPGQMHRCRISYHKGKDEVRFFIDEQEASVYHDVPCKMQGFTIALGLMTEKSISQGKSTSLHGQGLIGEWGPFTITLS